MGKTQQQQFGAKYQRLVNQERGESENYFDTNIEDSAVNETEQNSITETPTSQTRSLASKIYCCGLIRRKKLRQYRDFRVVCKLILFFAKIFVVIVILICTIKYSLIKSSSDSTGNGTFSISLQESFESVESNQFIPRLRMLTDPTDLHQSDVDVASPIISWLRRLFGSQTYFDSISAFCRVPRFFQIKTELNIPDLYNEIVFPKPTLNHRSRQIPITDNTSFIVNSETNATKWSKENKLKIYVVLHSHNDAGWQKTFQNYYHQNTRYILNNVLKYLTEDPELKFIWSEISFFDLWWKDLPTTKRIQVQKLVDNKQLEFVGGGWVMPDEACPHYLSLVTQLIEGHQWLQLHLNYTPRNGWAIDPFGLSSTSNFILKRSGLENTVFSRTHYLLLKLLVEKRKTEFYWRQQWDVHGATDILCYLMPYGEYDGRVTCGPDHDFNGEETQVCRMYSSKLHRKSEYMNDKEDIKRRALTLLNQYRKKAMLFNTNNVLIPIGEDFAWQPTRDWTDDIQMLKRIFEYINSSEDLNAEIKFSTLGEYFDAVHRAEAANKFSVVDKNNNNKLATNNKNKWTAPIFSGDFFTYSSNPQDYWSGYYSSRIFHKASERQLMTLVRSSQLMYSILLGEISKVFKHRNFNFIGQLFQKIVESRRTLSLFQHHDGITGTSRTSVVKNYAVMLHDAMHACHFVIQQTIHLRQILRSKNNVSETNFESKFSSVKTSDTFYEPVLNKSAPSKIWEDNVYTIDQENPSEVVAVVNSLAKYRKQVVRVCVTSSNVKVVGGSHGGVLQSEIFPVFKYFDKYSNISKDPWMKSYDIRWVHESESYVQFKNASILKPYIDAGRNSNEYLEVRKYFELVFIAELIPLEVKQFKIVYDASHSKMERKRKPRVRIFNSKTQFTEEFKNVFNSSMNSGGEYISPKSNTIQISNSYLAVSFNDEGMASSVEMSGALHPLEISFDFYRTVYSGLYSFFPLSESEPLSARVSNFFPVIIVVEGQLRSYVEVWLPNVRHRLTLFNHDGLEGYGIHIENTIDIRQEVNYELIMKVSTAINSRNVFYTDSNGFQMMRRENRNNLPIQGNYYPVASSSYIEDPDLRLTVLTGQPGGCASRKSGQLEIMLDRKVHQDDSHGVGQGGMDNLLTVSTFKIILETPSSPSSEPCQQSPQMSEEQHSTLSQLPLLSLEANLHQLSLLHPPLVYKKVFNINDGNNSIIDLAFDFDPKTPLLSCDIHLLGVIPLIQLDDPVTGILMNPSHQSAILLHRMGFDARFTRKHLKECATLELGHSDANNEPPTFGQVNIRNLFSDLFENQLIRTSVSLSHRDTAKIINGSRTLELEPMEIYAFIANYLYT